MKVELPLQDMSVAEKIRAMELLWADLSKAAPDDAVPSWHAESAQEDLLRGYVFYEEQQSGVGDYSVDALTAEIDLLILYAGIHPIRNTHHRMLSSKFPFAIYYKMNDDQVFVHAVLDCRQDPQSIEDRLH